MALVKFDRWKILYGDIKPEKVVPIKYQSYAKNAKGATIVDLNLDSTANNRKLLSLHTAKTSQIKFSQIVDIEFQDFPIQSNDNAIELLQSRLNALLSEKNLLLADRDYSKDKIDELNKVIEDLRRQLENAITEFGKFKPGSTPPDQINEIPDQIPLNARLYSDRKGRKGDPGYPLIQNQLLSKNRKARLIIQDDSNVIITKGEYNKKGEPLAPDEVVVSFGWDNSATQPNYLTLKRPSESSKSVILAVGGTKPNFKDRWTTLEFERVSNKARIVLDDIGILNIFDGERLVWSSFDLDPTELFYSVTWREQQAAAGRAATAEAARQAEDEERRKKEEEERLKREEEERRRNTGLRGVVNRVGSAIGGAAQAVGQGVARAATAVASAAGSVGRAIGRLFRSDRELKTDIVLVGQSPNGINIYEFRFKSDLTKKYQGVIADELLNTPFESAVYQTDDGYLAVDYSQIDVVFRQVE
jgi:hypothetical protein